MEPGRLSRFLACGAALLLAGCAANPVQVTRLDGGGARAPSPSVEMLGERPQRAYERIARLEIQGHPGVSRALVYDQLRETARKLGADALISLSEERKLLPAPPPTDDSRVNLGEAYSGALDQFDRGAFPYEGRGVATVGGVYWTIEALAIAYKP